MIVFNIEDGKVKFVRVGHVRDIHVKLVPRVSTQNLLVATRKGQENVHMLQLLRLSI